MTQDPTGRPPGARWAVLEAGAHVTTSRPAHHGRTNHDTPGGDTMSTSTSTTTDEKRQAVAIAADCLGQWLEYVAPDYLEDEPAPFLPAGVEVTVADVARALEVLEGMKP